MPSRRALFPTAPEPNRWTPKTHQVFDWLWTSGQLSERDIEALPGLSVEVVVNLALPTSSNALPGVAERVTGLGLAYVQIPVEWEDPLPAQFEAFAGVLAAFRGRRLWVHCAKNMRVSAFVYLYRRLLLGEAEEAAAFPLRTVWTPNPVWQDFMNRIAAAYARGPQAASARSGQPQG